MTDIKNFLSSFKNKIALVAVSLGIIISGLCIYLLQRIKASNLLLKEQYVVIHQYTAGISEALPAIAGLDAKTQDLYLKNNSIDTTAYVLLGVFLVTGFVLMHSIYKQYNSYNKQVITDLKRLLQNNNLHSQLDKKSDNEELRGHINDLLVKRSNAIDEANSMVQHLYSMAFNNLKNITAIAAKIAEQDSKATKVVASINNMTGSAKQLSVNSSKVNAAANMAQEKVNKAKSTIVEIRKATDFLKFELQNATDAIQKVLEDAKLISEIGNNIKDASEKTKLLAINCSIEAAKHNGAKLFAQLANEIADVANFAENASANVDDKIAKLKSGLNEVTQAIEQSSKSAELNLSSVLKANHAYDNITSSITNVIVTLEKINKSGLVGTDINKDIDNFKELSRNSIDNISDVAGVWQGQLELIKEYKEAISLDD